MKIFKAAVLGLGISIAAQAVAAHEWVLDTTDSALALGVGETMPVDLSATLHFLGKDINLSEPVIAVRLSDSRAMVVSAGMIWFDTEELGIDAGVDMLQELASLPSITRAVPVTFRLVFDMHM